MLAVLALGKVTVEHRQRLAVGVLEAADDHAPLGVLVVAGEAVVHRFQRLAGEQRDAVVAFLAEVVRVVPHVAHRLLRELAVLDLGFLQAHQGGAVLVEQRLQLVETGANAIDVE